MCSAVQCRKDDDVTGWAHLMPRHDDGNAEDSSSSEDKKKSDDAAEELCLP